MDIRLAQIILGLYDITEEINSVSELGEGHINDTFLITLESHNQLVLQRINTEILTKVAEMHFNIDLLSAALNSEQYLQLTYLKYSSGNSFATVDKHFYRLMTFIEGSQTVETTNDLNVASEAGRIIGVFHSLLEGVATDTLKITIPKFLDLNYRLQQFRVAFNDSKVAYNQSVDAAVRFVEETSRVFDQIDFEELPVRVCHNDTKLNNILFDDQLKALCLIDLDTIMPGYLFYDFGDAIRTLVNPASEDELDLTKICFNMPLFMAFVDGLKSSGLVLTQSEIKSLSLGAAYMPFIHGLRMLTDHLNGNIYYKVDYPLQNLDRAKNLFLFTRLALENNPLMSKYLSEIFE